ncbi:MAG: GNAT family N-acetyltransferase [Pelosinus sp.]|nr:GNAT family N-acetyltransferase [Pelosinus sp.]
MGLETKERYRQLCSIEPTIPVFSKDWWLDAVCGENNWDVVVYEQNNKIVASLPYYKKQKFGIKYCTMPLLTQTMGVWFMQNRNQTYYKKLSYEKKVIDKLLDKLPPLDMFYQNAHYSLTNWLPFYWRGFKQTTRYTYVIEDLTDADAVFSNFTREKKAKIKKAGAFIKVYQDDDIARFYKLNKLVFNRKKLAIPYSLEFLRRLDQACTLHNSRMIILGEDQDMQLHAAIYLVWDEMSAYLLMSGIDSALKASNAQSLLIWEAIKLLAGQNKKFDFEGSMIEEVEEFFKSFGAVQKPYFNLYKDNKKCVLLKTIRSIWKA